MSKQLQAPLLDLQAAIQRRMEQEQDYAARFLHGPSESEKSLTATRQQIDEQFQSWLSAAEEQHHQIIATAEQANAERLDDLHSVTQKRLAEIECSRDAERDEIEAKFQNSTWVASSLLDDTAEDSPRRIFERSQFGIEKSREELTGWVAGLKNDAQAFFDLRGWNGAGHFEPPQAPKSLDKLAELVQGGLERGRAELKVARSLLLPKLFSGFRSIVVFVVLMVAVATLFFLFVPTQPLGISGGRDHPTWFGMSAVVGAIVSLLLCGILYALAGSRMSDALAQLRTTCDELDWLLTRWTQNADRELTEAEKQFHKTQEHYDRQREQALSRYQQAHQDQLADIESRRAQETRAVEERLADQQAVLSAEWQTQHAMLDSQWQQQRQQAEQHYQTIRGQAQAALDQQQSDHRKQQATAWFSLKTGWEQAFQGISEQAASLLKQATGASPSFEELVSSSWTPAKEIPTGYSIGVHRVNLEQWPGAISSDMRLAPRSTELIIPAMVDFPSRASMLLTWKGSDGRTASVRTLQVAMLRLLTQIPPGKIRFTLIDPVALGESFAGFMHLADVDELLVTSRIWTEASQIEARLADLTEHMENVLQTYLRNEFATIEDYNHHAGEVAEPYRFLVISDFPAKFSEIAASRLLSIITSGPRCGVYTLMSVDLARDLPQQLSLETAAAHMTQYHWGPEGFRWRENGKLDDTGGDTRQRVATSDGDISFSPAADSPHLLSTDSPLSAWPVELTSPPDPEMFTRIVKQMAEASRDARRVEVSFDRIAPKPDEVWTKDSRSGIDIPLGRAGATKLQHLKLGQGTSQHMLVAGKTGSGKSTFLHTLIINTSLHYGPQEVNFYLIDFKKGVEFKDYASQQLPHARVVAIESDREFGVSALQRLDEILQERGELFRKHGVQDIRGYRDANPNTPLPRIMLVIDEFQEFFIEDDKLAQTASLMLDRLVRQGRAFGMHVILGSQTLGGAYSLARSTLGQIAVRVALQCSEADAHLILSEENTAARLLTRPGEAIYNDANGLIEGNHPFQVAWLADTQREELIRSLANQARRALLKLESSIVFEGNIPSDPARNSSMNRLIEGSDEGPSLRMTPRIWLGDAVEIKPPAELSFPRQSGSHLLLVGQDHEAALGLMGTAVVALAAQGENGFPSLPAEAADEKLDDRAEERAETDSRASLLIFDGSPVDTPDAEMWRTIAKSVPSARIVTPRQSLDVVKELTELMQSRDADRETVKPPIFVFVSQISRFRDLRKPDDDYSFGGFGGGETSAPSGGKLFADLIANGPENGIHLIIWCDSYNNLERWISRQSLRELERRVLFQMNATDSSNLIDSPVASRLGTHRALLHFQESGAIEKFRPYGIPKSSWLDWAAGCLQRRGPLDEATDLDGFMVT